MLLPHRHSTQFTNIMDPQHSGGVAHSLLLPMVPQVLEGGTGLTGRIRQGKFIYWQKSNLRMLCECIALPQCGECLNSRRIPKSRSCFRILARSGWLEFLKMVIDIYGNGLLPFWDDELAWNPDTQDRSILGDRNTYSFITLTKSRTCAHHSRADSDFEDLIVLSIQTHVDAGWYKLSMWS